jgi:hypothetical protein
VSNNADAKYAMLYDGPGFIKALAVGLSANGAMTRLDARENNIDDEGKRALQQAGGSRWGT